MAYPIELNITDVDHDKKTLKVQGQKITFKYFEEVIITPILNSQPPSWGVHVLTQLSAAGLRTHIWAAHHQEAIYAIQAQHEARQKADLEARQHEERMASMSATPAEIAEENAKKAKARQEEITRARSVAQGYF